MIEQSPHRATLLEIAQLARHGVLSGLPDASITPEVSRVAGTCLYTCYLALTFLRQWHTDFQPTLCGGGGGATGQGALDAHGAWRGHYWLEVADPDRRVWLLDATADQFGWEPITIDLANHLAHRYRKGDAAASLAALAGITAEIVLSPDARTGRE